MHRTRHVLTSALLAMCLAAPAAHATWSIVLTDSQTGEVAVGGATCINNLDLTRYLPVVVAGKGAAAAQALIDGNAQNRLVIWNGLHAGVAPDAMLAQIAQQDPAFEQRQIGVVDLAGRALTFSGSQTLAWSGGITGQVGSLTYAIQGNVLTGGPVIAGAEAAILTTQGDLAQRLMAGMLAARAFGGDGRCSCDVDMPTSCGSPPASFDKAAHVGFMLLARIGDQNGACTPLLGCATGAYYLDLNVKGSQKGKPDPVLQLEGQFAEWRAAWMGRPDALRSTVVKLPPTLALDGIGSLYVRLVDWQGKQLTGGGAAITVMHEEGSDFVTETMPVVDNGDGSYTVPLVPTGATGRDLLRIVAHDGISPVTLYPFTEVVVANQVGLEVDVDALSASAGGTAKFQFVGGSGLGGRGYVLLASTTGVAPGFFLDGVHVPLVLDPAVLWSAAACGSPALLPNSCGVLNAFGAMQAQAHLPPALLLPFVGRKLHFSLITVLPTDFASDPVVIQIEP